MPARNQTTPPEATHEYRTDPASTRAYPARPHDTDTDSRGRPLLTIWQAPEFGADPNREPLYRGTYAQGREGTLTPYEDTPAAFQAWCDSRSAEETERIRATFWAACDEMADDEGACSEYENTYARPNGHTGRQDQERDYSATVEVVRTVRVTYTFDITATSTDQAHEIASTEYSEYDSWPDEDSEDEEVSEVTIDGDSDDSDTATPPPLADLLREAMEHVNERRQYASIPEAGLQAVIEEHGAPIDAATTYRVSGRFVTWGGATHAGRDAATDGTTQPEEVTSTQDSTVIAWKGEVTVPAYMSRADYTDDQWGDVLARQAAVKVSDAYPTCGNVYPIMGAVNHEERQTFEARA